MKNLKVGQKLEEGKGRTVPSRVHAQIQKHQLEPGNVTGLDLTRLEFGIDKDEHKILHAVFPSRNQGSVFSYDLSYMLRFPELLELFSTAFLEWGRTSEHRSRNSTNLILKRNFFRYLEVNQLFNIRQDELDVEVFASFYEFLKNPKPMGMGLSLASTNSGLQSVRALLASLTSGKFSRLAISLVDQVPKLPKGWWKRNEPTEVLNLGHVISIVAAAEKELKELNERWERGKQLLLAGKAEWADGKRNYRTSLSLSLAAVDAKYPGVMPDKSIMIKDDGYLGRAVSEVHKAGVLYGYLYPTARDLMPMVILLACATVFNSETLLSLNWSNVDEHFDRAGTPAIRIVGLKPRSSQDHVRLLDAGSSGQTQTSISALLQLLREMTARLRPYVVKPSHQDRLFIFIQQTKCKIPKSFGTDALSRPGSDNTLRSALANFCKDNNIEKFMLKQLRPTLLDMALFLNGDLAASQALGNHRHPHTTWTFYTSSGVKKRFRERLGEVIVLRERWYQTNGAADPRQLMPCQDKGAATPGFLCLDPFDSPRPNQQKGRLCNAYGECPGCPLAAANISDVISVAQYFALKESIYRAQMTLSTPTWLKRWAPILADLNGLLELIPTRVRELSMHYRFNLPTVG